MSFKDQVTKPESKAPIIVLTGRAGSGKTSLAAMFGKTLFVRAEDGEQSLVGFDNVDLLPVIPTPTPKQPTSPRDNVLDVMRRLYMDNEGYDCLAIDSITALSVKIEEYILATETPNGKGKITEVMGEARGGYNKAYSLLGGQHYAIIDAAIKLRNKTNMTIIFIAHEGEEKIKNDPAELNEYTITSLQMHKDSAKHYINNADAVFFIDVQEAIVGADAKKQQKGVVKALGNRVIYTNNKQKLGLRYAKNRFNMPDSIEFKQGVNPLLEYIPYFNTSNPTENENN